MPDPSIPTPASRQCSCGNEMVMMAVSQSLTPVKQCRTCDVPDPALTLASLGFYEAGDLDVPGA